MMELIDFHTHVYPDKIAEKATDATCRFYGIHTDLTGRVDTLLKKGKEAGITRFVLLPVAERPDQVRHINEFVAGEVKKQSVCYGFGTVHAGMEGLVEEAAFISDIGLRGIKLHPDVQGFAIDDKRLFPLYDYLQDGMPVLFHCGDPRHDFSHPRRLRRVLELFPRLRVIAAHLGGWSLFEEAYACLRDADCFLDLSSCFRYLSPEEMRRYISGYGAERILFGTDFPLWEPKEEVAAFYRLNLPSAALEQIAYQNALRILE